MRTTPRLSVIIALAALAAAAAAGAAGASAATEDGKTYIFAGAEDCREWMHLTPGAPNEFADGVARLSAGRGRSFLLNTTPQPADVAVEVTVANESGPALAWILLRWRDANNFHEIVLKKSRVEIWRKHRGRYVGILPRRDIRLGDPAAAHVLKAQAVGPVPSIAVWLDGRLIWSGSDETGLGPAEGRYVALETEFSTVAVHGVAIMDPETDLPAAVEPAAASAVTYEEAFSELYETLGRQYPCFELKGIDWKAVGDEMLPRAKEVGTDDEFGLLCMELVARLEDSHASLLPGTARPPVVPFPQCDPGLACLVDDRGRPVVYHVDAGGPAEATGVGPGMTVVSIDGKDAVEAMEASMLRISRYVGYSSDRYLRYHAAQWLALRMEQGVAVSLVLEDADGRAQTLELPATLGVRYLPRLPVPIDGIGDSADVSWKMLPDNIGYIYVRRIRDNLIPRLDQAVGQLKDAGGLIIDVRGNSGGGFDSTRAFRNFSPEDPAEPGRPRFGGPVAMLIDARCISAGEGWASWFVANRRARLFGEATAGASSRKTTYTLKNGLYKVTFPVKAYTGSLDRPIERRGLEPDVPLRQNAADLARGRDTVLEAARDYLLSAAARETE